MTTVIKLHPSSTGSTVTMFLNTGNRLVVPIDLFIALKIRVGDTLNEPKISELQTETQKCLLKEYALRQLAISPKSENLLIAKLKLALKKINQTYQIKIESSNLVPDIIRKLKQANFFNDKEYCQHILRKYKSKSNRFIQYYLKQKGIEDEVIDEVLQNRDTSTESNALSKLLAKKIIRYQKLPKHTLKNKLLAIAYQNGFPISRAKSIIDELLSNR